jgi:3-oxoacyl-[acyl-carrier-protein] synthase-3
LQQVNLVNRHIRIAGTGSAVPAGVVPNSDLTTHCHSSDEWVRENLGIRERRIAALGQLTSDLATQAAGRALDNAGLLADDLDLIIVATATPDRQAPSTACIVQQKLGVANHCPAFDLAAVCSGFLYALATGSQFIQTGVYRNVLVIGADTFSRITDWDRRDCVFFGDGAGAVILQRTSAPADDGFFCFDLFADGAGQDNFTVFPGSAFFTMNSRAVYETGTQVLPAALQNLLARHQISPADIAWLIPHQPSVRVLVKTAETIGIPIERVCMNMDRYANTAGATIPLLLDEVARSGRIKPGDLVAFAAVGAGWTWGAALYRWQPTGSRRPA